MLTIGTYWFPPKEFKPSKEIKIKTNYKFNTNGIKKN
jgi:hypothetical protein